LNNTNKPRSKRSEKRRSASKCKCKSRNNEAGPRTINNNKIIIRSRLIERIARQWPAAKETNNPTTTTEPSRRANSQNQASWPAKDTTPTAAIKTIRTPIHRKDTNRLSPKTIPMTTNKAGKVSHHISHRTTTTKKLKKTVVFAPHPTEI